MTDVRPSIRPSVDDAAERWVSFADLAEQRGISRAAASKLVRRHGWRRQTDNQGRVLILVPETALDRPTVRPSPSNGDATNRPAVDDAVSHLAAGALAALEDAVQVLREQLERAERGRDDERQRADDLRAQIEVLNAELVVSRAELEAERDAARRDARAARDAAEALRQADDARKARGLLARLRAAWRGK